MSTSAWPPTDRWFAVPWHAFDVAPQIGPAAFLVYAALCRRANATGKCWPSIACVQADCGLSDSHVRRAIKALINAQLVEVKHCKSDRDRNMPNTYQLLGVPATRPSTTAGDSTTAGEPTSTTAGGETLLPPVNGGTRSNELKPYRTRTNSRALRFEECDLAIAREIFEHVVQLYPHTDKPNFDKWANELRILREKKPDATPEGIRSMFEWVKSDDFWRTNIRSTHTLRKQWDQLSVKRTTGANRNGSRHTQRHGATGQRHDPDRPISQSL